MSLRLKGDGKLVFKMGRPNNNNRLKFESNDKFNDGWVAVYVDYNGGRTEIVDGLITKEAVASRFRFYKVDLRTGMPELISGSWNWSDNNTGFNDNIEGHFYIGTRYDQGNLSDYFKGQIAAVTVTTLRTVGNLPKASEIALMTLDPKLWLKAYKIGKYYRLPNENRSGPNFYYNE